MISRIDSHCTRTRGFPPCTPPGPTQSLPQVSPPVVTALLSRRDGAVQGLPLTPGRRAAAPTTAAKAPWVSSAKTFFMLFFWFVLSVLSGLLPWLEFSRARRGLQLFAKGKVFPKTGSWSERVPQL